jgi:ribosomal protein S18 acetylase RimI-like enzyme
MFKVRLATRDDLGTILRLIEEAADWLRTKDTNQWATPWPNEQERDARVLRGLHAGATWIVEDGSSVVATITCRPDANPDLWPKPWTDEQAVYVSRLIINRDYAGQAIGEELLDWAGKWAVQQYAVRWIRIDVWTTNVALHGYYEKRGFDFVQFCAQVNYPSAALFQRSTAGLEWTDTPRLKEVPILLTPFRPVEGLLAGTIAAIASGKQVAQAGSRSRSSGPLKPFPLRLLARQCRNLTIGRRSLVTACRRAHRLSIPRCMKRLERRHAAAGGSRLSGPHLAASRDAVGGQVSSQTD